MSRRSSKVFFKRYVEYDFTADLEEQLDRISDGEIQWKEVLRDFWKNFTVAIGEVKDLRVTQVIDALNDCWHRIFFRQGLTVVMRAPALPVPMANFH